MKQYNLQISQIIDDKLIFDNQEKGFFTALHDGFFFLKIPDGIDLSSGDLFATNFYKDKHNAHPLNDFRGFKQYTPDKLAQHEGYYCRKVDQTEQFFLEKRFWDDIYPRTLVNLANQLKDLSIIILNNILLKLNIPQKIWYKATGGCSNNKGMYHLTFNNFRPEKEVRGLNIHKDSGWITILRSLEPGLEAYINEEWIPITPKQGYFIINFGCAFEILTKSMPQPVNAITHKVTQQFKSSDRADNRFSYALFADSALNKEVCKGLYEYDFKTQKLVFKMDLKTFLDNILKATYHENTVGLY